MSQIHNIHSLTGYIEVFYFVLRRFIIICVISFPDVYRTQNTKPYFYEISIFSPVKYKFTLLHVFEYTEYI